MKIKNISYNDLQDYFDNFDNYCEDPDFDDETVVNIKGFGDKDFVLLIGPAYRVPEKNLIFASGLFYTYDEKEGRAEPDYDIVLIYDDVEEDSEFNPDQYVYMEDGSEMTAIHNFLYYKANSYNA